MFNDGELGENLIFVVCMYCIDVFCMVVCLVDCFVYIEDGIVLYNKDFCIGCGYCLFVCLFGVL